ncbi:MAG: cytochrome c biogenesis protein ResB, partial [Verrucomicrobiales bacterium]|nr:cytochrome c biogenesis protein ResB [Verrucomicrobiales bacterium]
NMMLWPGERSGLYRSYNDWSIEVKEMGEVESEILVIPESEFGHLEGKNSRTFFRDGLPFDLVVSHYSRNASLRKAAEGLEGADAVGGPVARKAQISPEPLDPTAEANVGAVYVEVAGDGVKSDRGAILWAGNDDWTHEVEMEDGRKYSIAIIRHGWSVPFEIELEKFTRVLHPNTGMAKEFNSRVKRVSGEEERDVLIEMNEPLRHDGFTFFQASWGPQNDPRAAEFYTVLAVVKNPSDQWPKYFIYIVTLGLVVHFVEKLMRAGSKGAVRKSEKVES